MRLSLVIVALLLVSTTLAKYHTYEEFTKELRKPAIEASVVQILESYFTPEVVELLGGQAYNIARTGVGCAAGVFGGLNTGFTIWDVISQAPRDIDSYIFGAIYAYAWWQQNGQYMEYMCSNFWDLVH
ncbi:unnamed protein product [Moneuplotes crassus]|uniref:Uncharacterized protein n=2 Tax=Euplotes crassus TaxID=5936 RepID=A0AAD1Y194_EUPCR|nr:unnamed protein product [Moneuplotes crassus]|eukprot:CAMPEP_0197003674 /NCGR_PEP_ID=MMETSP1380-20130617/11246_1 /TAXON_ID=5936 /ORGANISM="Euplotes crassus, Strain CT5" /LENGTH=127 /DNA_ID=CAMNT_0042422245 /DNA_START=1 /DNA_END=384 /DNA_ORIENTATION=+